MNALSPLVVSEDQSELVQTIFAIVAASAPQTTRQPLCVEIDRKVSAMNTDRLEGLFPSRGNPAAALQARCSSTHNQDERVA